MIPHDISLSVDACFRGVLQASWQGALAVGLVLLVRWAFGMRVPARWHYLLWFLVLARLLLPTFALPHSPTSLENLGAVAHPFGRPPLVPTQMPTIPISPFTSSSRPSFPPAFAQQARLRFSTPAPAQHPWSWWTWAAWAWLGGVLTLCGWLAVCHLKLRRRLRRQSFPVEHRVQLLWQACCRRWLRRTAPQILAADWVNSPALVGWWRPTLLVPQQSLSSFSTQDWEHVFAHEIAHLRWRDHWSQGFMLAAWCVHWFNPVVWIGFRRLRADRELAADEWVLKHLDNERALAYGETLFKTLAARSAHFSFQPGMVGISEDGAQMKQRLQRIAAFLPQRRIVGSLAGLSIVLLLGTVVLGQSSPEPTATPATKEGGKAATTSTASPEKVIGHEAQNLSDRFVAAARAGNAAEIDRLVKISYSQDRPAKFDTEAATKILNGLAQSRELAAFTVLLDQLQRTKRRVAAMWRFCSNALPSNRPLNEKFPHPWRHRRLSCITFFANS